MVSRFGEVNASRIEGFGAQDNEFDRLMSKTICGVGQPISIRSGFEVVHKQVDPLVIMHKWNPEASPEPAFDACCWAKQPQQHSYSPEGGPPWLKKFKESFVQLRMETGDSGPRVNGP